MSEEPSTTIEFDGFRLDACEESDFERSIGYFKAAADMDPGFLDAHIGLFRAYRAQRDLPRVAGELEKIKQCSSEDSVIYTYHRGLLLASEGKVAAAMSSDG
ncbi:MAG: tetratricopeptide repeat protein [Acidobacteriota bacterium]|nr:tetratricopeptide repeat protein [Acidobacteriota bacterium]MDH3530028.1 tetratricopeptide repeat protein [Acidobacteriota bacterium]